MFSCLYHEEVFVQVPPELRARRKEPGARQESPSAAPALQPPHFSCRSVFAFDFFV